MVRDLARGEVDPKYIAWFGKRFQIPERPTKRPHVQQFTDGAQVQWDRLTKENEYRAKISELERQVMELQFENGVQAVADKGEKKKLAQENEALKAQIQKMKIAARNLERSRADKRLISRLKNKALECQEDLEKSEVGLAKIRAKWTKKAEERARFVQQMKKNYEGTITILRRKIATLGNEAVKQAKDFKDNREHCYDLMAQMEEGMQQLQNQYIHDSQVLEARNQQIGWLLQEKCRTRERIRTIADYITMKCQACEDMTRTTFFAAVMIFVRQVMSNLERLQGDLAYQPVARPNDIPRAPGALMYS
ncbi:uncharacterized protein [Nicotiana sylvestris]|uniref:uncharacterized protein n=1 Tax=Nicotiana sylvestris TaxID=4096 RepID=UPI00388C3E49